MFFLSISFPSLLSSFFLLHHLQMFLWSKKTERCIGRRRRRVRKSSRRKRGRKTFQLFDWERVKTKWDENPSDLVALVDGIGCCLVWKIAKVLKVNLTKINLKSSPNNKSHSHSLTVCSRRSSAKFIEYPLRRRVAINLCVTCGGVKVLHRFSRRLTPSDYVVVSFYFWKTPLKNFLLFFHQLSSRKVKENCTAALEKNTFNDTKYARKAAQLPPRCESNYSKQIINDVESCLIPAAHSATSYTPSPCRSLRFFFSIFIPPHQKAKKKHDEERGK